MISQERDCRLLCWSPGISTVPDLDCIALSLFKGLHFLSLFNDGIRLCDLRSPMRPEPHTMLSLPVEMWRARMHFPHTPFALVHWTQKHISRCSLISSNLAPWEAASHDSGSQKDLSMCLWVASLNKGVNVSQASMTFLYCHGAQSYMFMRNHLSSFHCQEPSVPHRDGTHKHELLVADHQAWFRGLHLVFCSAHILLSGCQSPMAEASGILQKHQMFLSFSDSWIPTWRTFSG